MKPWTAVLLCVSCSIATSFAMYAVLGGALPAPTDVPTLVGLNVEQARKLGDAANLLLRFEGERVPDSDAIPPGTVLDQKPLGGSRVRSGDVIVATLAAAPQRVKVPHLLEQPIESARQALEEAGLRVGKIVEVISNSAPPGQIVETHPGAGSELRKGETVGLTVTKAPETTVPNLRGLSTAGAKAALEKAGLLLGERRFGVDDNAADGVTLRQSPAAGSQLPRGGKVDIVVNQ
jgi:beta-lactam-binding protein with PASTA domain